MGSLATAPLTLLFLLAAILTWFAGSALSNTTAALDSRFKLGDALGGLVLLGFATSLPEVAIVVSGAANHHFDIVVGDLIGGIAVPHPPIRGVVTRAPLGLRRTLMVLFP